MIHDKTRRIFFIFLRKHDSDLIPRRRTIRKQLKLTENDREAQAETIVCEIVVGVIYSFTGCAALFFSFGESDSLSTYAFESENQLLAVISAAESEREIGRGSITIVMACADRPFQDDTNTRIISNI